MSQKIPKLTNFISSLKKKKTNLTLVQLVAFGIVSSLEHRQFLNWLKNNRKIRGHHLKSNS